MSGKKERQTYPLQLCVFDSQRDYPEGEEAQRILAYYPTDCSIDEQTAVIGLAEALATFSNNFDEVLVRPRVPRVRSSFDQTNGDLCIRFRTTPAVVCWRSEADGRFTDQSSTSY